MDLFSNALNYSRVSGNQLVRLAYCVNKYRWVFYTCLSGLDIENIQTKTINNSLRRIVCVFRDKSRIEPRSRFHRTSSYCSSSSCNEHVINPFINANRWRVKYFSRTDLTPSVSFPAPMAIFKPADDFNELFLNNCEMREMWRGKFSRHSIAILDGTLFQSLR